MTLVLDIGELTYGRWRNDRFPLVVPFVGDTHYVAKLV